MCRCDVVKTDTLVKFNTLQPPTTMHGLMHVKKTTVFMFIIGQTDYLELELYHTAAKLWMLIKGQ